MLLTLLSMHGRAIAQEPAVRSDDDSVVSQIKFIFDPYLPGSPIYNLARGVEKIERLSWTPQQQSQECLERSKHRLQASHYAWQQGRSTEAITAFKKSFMYLQESIDSASASSSFNVYDPEVSQLVTALDSTVEAWLVADLTDQQRNQLQQTSSQLQALCEQNDF